jgi:hypothetical protein
MLAGMRGIDIDVPAVLRYPSPDFHPANDDSHSHMPPITNRQARSASAVAAGSPNRRTANLRVTPMEYGRIEYGGLPVKIPHIRYCVVLRRLSSSGYDIADNWQHL